MRRGAGLLLLLLLLFSATAVGSAEPLAVVRVPPRADVAGPDIVLGDIADIEADDTELARQLEQLSLGRAAMPGQSRRLNVGTIRIRMRQRSLPEKQIVIDMPESAVLVTTRAQTVSGSMLAEAAEDAVLRRKPWGDGSNGAADGGAEVVLACATPSDVTVGDGTISLHVSRLIGSPPGPMVVSIDINSGNKVERTVMVRCDASVALDVPVTTVSLRRHDALTEKTVTVERREFSSLPRGLLSPDIVLTHDSSDAAALRVARPLAAGTVLTDSMVEMTPVVVRGLPVQIVAAFDQVEVSAPGVALADGRIGDVIRVENSASGQVIRARVIAADRVEAVVR